MGLVIYVRILNIFLNMCIIYKYSSEILSKNNARVRTQHYVFDQYI